MSFIAFRPTFASLLPRLKLKKNSGRAPLQIHFYLWPGPPKSDGSKPLVAEASFVILSKHRLEYSDPDEVDESFLNQVFFFCLRFH